MKSSGTITNSDPMSRSHLKPGQKVGLLTLNRIVGVKTKERRRKYKSRRSAETKIHISKEFINVWECKCECGNTCTRTEYTLLQDNIHSCGCYRRSVCTINAAKAYKAKAKLLESGNGRGTSLLSKKPPVNNSSGIQGVVWHKKSKKWRAYINHKRKHIELGSYERFKDAVAVREEAVAAVIAGNFEEWNEEFQKNKRLGGGSKEGGGVRGVAWIKKTKKWEANIQYKGKKKYLGTFEGFDDAVSVRKKAVEAQIAGNFEEWYAEYQKNRKPVKEVSVGRGVWWSAKTKEWRTYIYHKIKRVELGGYENFDDAVSVMQRALEAIKAGNFEEWITEFREKE